MYGYAFAYVLACVHIGMYLWRPEVEIKNDRPSVSTVSVETGLSVKPRSCRYELSN